MKAKDPQDFGPVEEVDFDPADKSALAKAGRGSKLRRRIPLIVTLTGIFVLAGLIAVPNLIEARRIPGEASVIGSLRTLHTAQMIFRESDRDRNGVFDYGKLQDLGEANLVDAILAGGMKQGYIIRCFPVTDAPEHKYWATAKPGPQLSGERYYFTNQSGVIYFAMRDFEVDPNTGEVPEGLRPLGGR